jgi:hypothetical protein
MVVAHYETTGGLTDLQVYEVIESDCHPHLVQIRENMNSGLGSTLDPYDVIDPLNKSGILHGHFEGGGSPRG